MKRILFSGTAMLAVFVLLFSACTPIRPPMNGGEPEESQPAPSALTVSLPYFASDSVNPYFAASAENRSLGAWLFEPLFAVNADYSARAVLAESIAGSGLQYTVRLREARFSDGSTVTPADAVYSFRLAKSSALHGSRLAAVQEARASDGQVTFTLSAPNPMFANLLTFPIVKRGTADRAADLPIGTGAFVLSADGAASVNAYAEQGAVEGLTLVPVQDTAKRGNALEIGNIDYMFSDFQDGVYTRIVAQNQFVTMNNLVYLGINSTVGALRSAAVRTAIYYAADKDAAAASAYRGCAEGAALPFHPAFIRAQAVLAGQTAADSERASSILKKLGFTRYNKAGRLTNGRETLEFPLLVNQENGFRLAAAYSLAENLNAAGFAVTVTPVSAAEFASRVAAGNFSLALGEIKLGEDLSLAPFFGGSAGSGIDTSLPVFDAYAAYAAGEQSLAEFAAAFLDDMPFVPICYRAGMASFSRRLQPDFSLAAYAVYGDVTQWAAAQ